MSYMFEVIYRAPSDSEKEAEIASVAIDHGGVLDCREEPEPDGPHSIVLTFEFATYDQAFAAAQSLRARGHKIDGPYDYGD